MLLLDLKVVLAFLLLLLAAAVLATIFLDRRSAQRRALPGTSVAIPLFDPAPVGVLLLEGNTCRYCNPYAQRLLGLPSAAGPLPSADWVPVLDQDRAAARQEAAAGRYRRARLGTDRFVRWWVTPYARMDFVFLLDETAPHQAEQAARFLLSDLSHELRTPLATLLTHLQILQLANIREEVRQQSLQLMNQETRRMTRLVHDLLELGRLETSAEMDRRPVDLAAVAEAAVAQVTPEADARGMSLSLQSDTPLPPVVGNADALRQVLLNLLDNALKYSRDGDRVTVSLHCDSAAHAVTCAVCDTGPGIPAEHLPRITQRFYRAAPDGVEGSGLGLALVEEILRRHESRLELESRAEPGPAGDTGTCARFSLPVALAREGQVA